MFKATGCDALLGPEREWETTIPMLTIDRLITQTVRPRTLLGIGDRVERFHQSDPVFVDI